MPTKISDNVIRIRSNGTSEVANRPFAPGCTSQAVVSGAFGGGQVQIQESSDGVNWSNAGGLLSNPGSRALAASTRAVRAQTNNATAPDVVIQIETTLAP